MNSNNIPPFNNTPLVSIHIDRIGFTRKPDSNEIKSINTRLAASKPKNYSLDSLAAAVCKGQTFTISSFDGTARNAASVTSTSFLSLDFDMEHKGKNGIYKDGSIRPAFITSEEIIKRSISFFGSSPSFGYKTFSYSEEMPKCRFLWLFNSPITNIEKYKTFAILVREFLFPEADGSVTTAERMTFGGTGLLSPVNTIDTINPDKLDSFLWNLASSSSPDNLANHFEKLVENFVRKSKNINQLNPIYVPTKISELLIELSPDFARKSGISKKLGTYSKYRPPTFSPDEDLEQELHEELVENSFSDTSSSMKFKEMISSRKNINFKDVEKKLLSNCNVIRDFYNLEIMDHDLMVDMSESFPFIAGGPAWIKKTLERRIAAGVNKPDKLDSIKYAMKRITKQEVLPTNCENMACPYFDSCTSRPGKNIYSILRYKDSERVYKNDTTGEPFIEVNAAREQLEANLTYSLESPMITKYFIKAETGLGKTNLLKKLIKEGKLNGCIIIFKTIAKLEEFRIELGKVSGEIYFATSIWNDEELEERDKEEFRERHTKALSGTIDHMKRIMERETTSATLKEKIKKCIESYEVLHYKDTVITTHARGIIEKDFPNHHTIISDEDLDDDFLNMHVVPFSDIANLIEQIEIEIIDDKNQENEPILTFLEEIRLENHLERIPLTAISKKFTRIHWNNFIYKNRNLITSKIIKLYDSPVFIKSKQGTLHFLEQKHMFPNKKVLILSATLDEEIVRMQCGNDAEFLKIPPVVKKGKIIQFSRTSMSRDNIKKDMLKKDIRQFFIDTMGLENMKKMEYFISFQFAIDNFKEVLTHCDSNHFYANLGLNKYTGKDGAVIGTPFPTIEQVVLFHAGITNSFDRKKFLKNDFSLQQVDRNGFSSRLYLLKDEEFRKIQLYLIEKELTQSVGRSRLIDNPATVYLFSTYPLGGNVELPLGYN